MGVDADDLTSHMWPHLKNKKKTDHRHISLRAHTTASPYSVCLFSSRVLWALNDGILRGYVQAFFYRSYDKINGNHDLRAFLLFVCLYSAFALSLDNVAQRKACHAVAID
jgi:hypothetical protein